MFTPEESQKNYHLAKSLDIPIVTDLKSFAYIQEKKTILPYSFVKKYGVMPIAEDEKQIFVALCDPLNVDSIEEIRLHFGKLVQVYYCPQTALEEAVQLCYHQEQKDKQEILSSRDSKSTAVEKISDEEGYDLLDEGGDNPVIRFLNAILLEAISQGASDIHFEPQISSLQVRYRIDGVLQKRHVPPRDLQRQLVTRIKVIAKLDIAESRLPQDGRIKLKMGGKEIDFRVSTIPVVYGERIALRILDKSNVMLGIHQLGMNKTVLNTYKNMIRMNEGIVLVTGPTGSGKTTTLYSSISEVNSSQMNIMTIEDPVEYKLPSIAQIGVNPKIGLSFAMGLRHILRQDPDAIMIGEIRDVETAEIAIQSALTGHLVLSTLHTNDAASALTRLAEMGIEPYLLNASIIGVLAQRLVRKVCPHCAETYLPSKGELEDLGIDPSAEGSRKRFVRGKGCEECFHTGYRGRHGIYELMSVSPKMKKMIVKKAINADEIKKLAIEEGMCDLRASGIELVKKGITTSEEVLRVTRTLNNA